MSNKPQVPHYTVRIEGTYYAKTDTGKKVSPYELTVKVPYSVRAPKMIKVINPKTRETEYTEEICEQKIDDVGILSFLVGQKYLHEQIRKTHPSFVGIRTHEIADVTPSHDDLPLPSNPESLSKVQLKKLIQARGYQINMSLFPETRDLRNAVLNFIEDPECYKTFEMKWKVKHGASAAFMDAMDKLNDEPTAKPEI